MATHGAAPTKEEDAFVAVIRGDVTVCVIEVFSTADAAHFVHEGMPWYAISTYDALVNSLF